MSFASGESARGHAGGGFRPVEETERGSLVSHVPPLQLQPGWHGEWFYIRNPAAAPFPVFTGGMPEKQDSWSWGCARKEKKKVEIIEEEL